MRHIKQLMLITALITIGLYKVNAQDVSINILNQPAAVSKGSMLGRVTVDICNNDGGSRSAAIGKLQPVISFPNLITGSSVVTVTTTGWSVISNDGQTIRLQNSTAIAPGECSQIVLGYTGVSVGGPLPVLGTLQFNGLPTFGNLPGNDISTTSITVFLDTDGDTIADTIDLDDDNDGILDVFEDAQFSADLDGDGVPNSLDLDSDNDGINDVIEAGGVDADNDGIADGTVGLTGIPTSANQITGTVPPDSDLDTRTNPYDLDSDNDGINDIIESGNPALIDANGDGIVDGTDPDGDGIVGAADGSSSRGDSSDPTPINTDGTGLPDYLDTDSDEDGLSDLLESGIASAATLDLNRDGRVDLITDLDGDGIVTPVDGSASYGDANNPTLPDSNTNGIPDYREANPDIDGDGVTNAQEISDGTDYANGCDYNPSNQVLANTSTTWRNSDCDGDGVTNYKEATGTDNNATTTGDNTNPLDGCSYNAVDQVLGSTSPEWKLQDCDKDGNLNGTDLHPQVATALDDSLVAIYGSLGTVNVLLNDDFLVGVTTTVTRTGGTAAGTAVFAPATGILSYTPTFAERGTTVTVTYQVCNIATVPNVCANAIVNITVPVDTDADGVPDTDDLDDDNDGILDTVESAQLSADTDGDGIPNRLDLDSDNDGINDVDEANGIDLDGDGMADGIISVLGIPTTAGTGLLLTLLDVDGDSKPNPYDLDSDNDGFYDLIEGGLNPSLDIDNNGIVDCSTNCDPDGDGILTPVDGLPNVWKDALLPDLTPTTEINSLEFSTAGTSRDFVVNVFEINNKPNVSGSTIVLRVAKISGFTITYSSTSGNSDVFVGGTANSNSDWTFTENANFITVTAKPGVVIPQNGKKTIGFTATRKTDVPSNTSQNITVTIIYGSAGEEKVNNNTVETKITAN
ncbi:hypothetical protein [Flectobacillus longus]|uniref:hypothetical protein n=1 Tax=Flectobacillus longus TaxID=2984207 RepID=UPI0024B72C6E|nr:hypothetical protein [Flectobacillus longus]MDI9882623.1 hypothetical protein [Flectobacillus longus]